MIEGKQEIGANGEHGDTARYETYSKTTILRPPKFFVFYTDLAAQPK